MRRICRACPFFFVLQLTSLAAPTADAGTSDAPPPTISDANKTGDQIEGTFKSFDPGTDILVVSVGNNDMPLTVGNADAIAAFADAKPGDQVTFVPEGTGVQKRINKPPSVSRATTGQDRTITLAASVAAIVGVASLMLRRSPLAFLVGVDNRYSNSQTQLALWFVTVATAYAATVVLRIWSLGFDYVGGVSIPQNLLLLSGLSALSFGGAKVITVQKTGTTGDKPKADKPRLADLVQNDDKEADLGDFQMIFITLAAVGIFCVSAFHFLGRLSLLGDVTRRRLDASERVRAGAGGLSFQKGGTSSREGVTAE
jgi:hypothetical protein